MPKITNEQKQAFIKDIGIVYSKHKLAIDAATDDGCGCYLTISPITSLNDLSYGLQRLDCAECNFLITEK